MPDVGLHRALLVVGVSLTLNACGDSGQQGAEEVVPSTMASAPSDASQLPIVTTELTPGESGLLTIGTHCGVGVLGRIVNGSVWRTSEADATDWVPFEWESGPMEDIEVVVALSEDGSTLTVEMNGRAVTYEQDGTEFTESDMCA